MYTLDNGGNRTAKTDDLANVTTNYNYDSVYQLLSATQGSTTTESYTYDPVGNRLSSLGVASYTINSSNELTSDSNASFTYDNNGNTLTKTDSTGTRTYAWGYENRLTSVTLPGSVGTVSFKYDPFDRRIQKSSAVATSIFVYDAANLVETTNGSGTELTSYTQGPISDEHLAMLTGTITSYYEQDGLRSVTSLTTSGGSLAQTYSYDSFGNITNSSGSLTNLFRYAGREFDTEPDLYYYRARYYDHAAGRFLSEDPIGFEGSGTNFYAYVGNDPVGQSDPFGLCHSCIGYFFKQTWNHANPFTPDVSTPAGEAAGFAYSAIQYNKYAQFVGAKYSNVFRLRALGRATESIGRGAVVGLLTTLVVSEGEALYDEYNAFEAGECQ